MRLFLMLAGATLVLCAIAGVAPLLYLTRLASPDGVLDSAFSESLLQAQLTTGLALVFASLMANTAMRWYAQWIRWIQQSSMTAFLGSCGVTAVILGALTHGLLLDGIPHVTDEISHLFQSKIFSSGALRATAPPCPEAFVQHHIYITTDGRWFSIYPPGHALLLAAMRMAGAEGWLSPLCFGISTVALGWLAHRCMRQWTARRLTMLFVACPLNWLLAGSFMSHFSFMALFLAGLCFFVRLIDTTNRTQQCAGHGFSAGLLLAYTFLIRPQDTVLASVIMFTLLMLAAPGVLRTMICRAGWLIPGAMLPAMIMLAWNYYQYGSLLALGYAHGLETIHPMLKPSFGFSDDFGPRESLQITGWTLWRLNGALLGWPVSLLPMLFALRIRSRDRRINGALAAVVMLVSFYFFYFYYGAEYEARFYHTGVIPMLYLVVRGFDRISARIGYRRRIDGRLFVVLVCISMWIHTLLFYVPRYLWPRYHGAYEQASRVVHDTALQQGLQRALVLIPSDGENKFRYSSGFMWNDPALDADIIYARDQAGRAACLAQAFPGRALYRFVPSPDWTTGTVMRIRE